MEENEERHRLFFALWPSDAVRTEIDQQIQPRIKKHPAKKVPLHNWHITLAFLGNVSPDTKQCVIEQAAQVHADHFELQLTKLGFFKRARVVWLGSEGCPSALTSLLEQLNKQLAVCGYQTDFKTFIPHMTLLRKANKGLEVNEFNAIQWPVTEFVLVESVTDKKGAIYQVIKRWPLDQ
ncbi:MAG: RNA 2',3'-cyclic phosphodiesterase [Thioalkalispiraceae bacterium]|jgi:2'-5' RNA ligase